jgi:hypothetical protein
MVKSQLTGSANEVRNLLPAVAVFLPMLTVKTKTRSLREKMPPPYFLHTREGTDDDTHMTITHIHTSQCTSVHNCRGAL